MKTKFLLTILMGFSILGQAQNVEVGFGFGTGATYIFENQDKNVDVSYSAPFSNYAHITYSPEDSYFDLKMNFQYLNSGIEGKNWKTESPIKGEVSSFTSSLMLEHLTNNQTWNFGYNFGFGYTVENYIESFEFGTPSAYRRFMSATVSALLSANISERVSIQLSPSLLWSDPANSFRSSDNWKVAGEDLNFLTQLGFVYKLK
jgi:hypothetical protein